jgi:hypothetical protein
VSVRNLDLVELGNPTIDEIRHPVQSIVKEWDVINLREVTAHSEEEGQDLEQLSGLP